ncbi:MAG: sugar ABC transporter permease [Oscillospiraceae bacterium]|nr:sugar ABC transporter permease [Oscillospiraceae bacterium]MBR6609696.1 sugar ABC transporter permease [Oscillospiraceae bacterium]
MAKTKAKKKPEIERVAGRNEKREKLMGYLMAMPAIVLLFAFTVYPLFYMAYRSLYGGSVISRNPKFVGFDNYKALIESTDFHQVLMNTAVYTAITVGLTMVLAIVIAVWLNGKRNSKLNGIAQTFIFTPHIISMVSVSTLFLWLMDSQNGLLNVVLTALGFEPYSFLASPETALLSVSLVSVWKGLGYYVLLIMAALQNIPTSVYEAAEMDDTPPLRTFFKITLPMISPTILFTSVVAVIASFKVFDSVSIMTGGGPVNSTNTLVYYIYDFAYSYGKPGQACAAGMVLLLFVCVVTYVQFLVGKKRVHYQ